MSVDTAERRFFCGLSDTITNMQNIYGLRRLLSRTNLEIPFEKFLEEVKKAYDFQEIYWYEPILEGYENANIKIATDKGIFVIKIFAKEVTDDEAEGNIKVITQAREIGIPLTKLLESKNGFLSKLKQQNATMKYMIMHFFEGPNFENQTVYDEDIIQVTDYIARLNSFTFPVKSTYDSWGNKNLVTEYEKNKERVSQEVYEAIAPVMEDLSKIDFTGFSESIIHGDLQRKHVLKNKAGEYCILDLGCMRNDARVFDLSIHFAWFCLCYDTWNRRDEVVRNVLDTYQKILPLSEAEIASLPTLTQAAYAAYYLKTSLLMQDGDDSMETLEWHNAGKEMVKRCKTWKWQI